MRLTRVEFVGYKRLRRASCNVDGRTIAFIGPNEAGKTSVLQGLRWLSDAAAGALPLQHHSRTQPPSPTDPVVRAVFRLDEEDIAALTALDIEPIVPLTLANVPEFRASKRVDGILRTGLASTISRDSAPFEVAAEAILSIRPLLKRRQEADDDFDSEPLENALALCEIALATQGAWTQARSDQLAAGTAQVRSFFDSLSEDEFVARKQFGAALRKVLRLLDTAASAAVKRDPDLAIREVLQGRMPRFVLFSDQDRILEPEYNLADDTVRSAPPAPLMNFLRVAGTTTSEIWQQIESGDRARIRTLERRMNGALRTRIQPMWTQTNLTLEVVINLSGLLELNINELDNPELTVTPIAERSDGLRAFLALVCFLIAADLEAPPILMIDEAERNLHYDAQADLVRVLTHDLRVAKVLYTTHSPGCLPLDLGTGIRVVQRGRTDPSASSLENNFWTDAEPGFSRLLFAMGAEAAAFSAFRRAVLAEGVSEMVLLPTLLRNATDGRELDFQVAFGLSNMSAPTALGTVALITTFLVDGDESGTTKKRQLELEGVPGSHIVQLPKGNAIEDLVDRDVYLDAVDEWLTDMQKPPVDRGLLATSGTIARAVDDYCSSHLDMPQGVSHKIICIRLAALGQDLKLSSSGRRALPKIRERIESALAVPYKLTEASPVVPDSRV